MRNSLFALAAAACLGLAAGCGGGGGSSSTETGSVSVLLQDAPMITVNGKTFEAVNVVVTGFAASPPRNRTFPFTLVTTGTAVNLLDLTTDTDLFAVAPSLPVGLYDQFQLTVETTTAQLIEDNGTVHPLTISDPSGVLTFTCTPPLRVDATQANLLIVDWRADRSVRFNAQTGEYVLSGDFRAFPLNRASAPVTFRALPARIFSTNGTDELRVQLERHNSARYLVKTTANTAIVDAQGNPQAFSTLAANDFVIISGEIDANTDITATRVRELPTSGHQPGGHNGGGHNGGGGNPSGGNGGPTAGTQVFAFGALHRLDPGANTFVLRTPHRGPIAVTYDEAKIFIARPLTQTNENALTPTGNRPTLVEVAGSYVPPATSTSLPGIDATGPNGRVLIVR